jgi:glycosyltransferase involved in cell wall biosynthesis
MNVGLVVPGFSADPSDWCIPALRHLARTLATADDVRVIALRYPYRQARYPIDGADVIAVGGADRHGAGTLPLWRGALGLIAAEHHRRPFDVLHAFWATESGLLAALAGRYLRIPTLVSLAGGELVALRDIAYGDQRVAWERLKVSASLRVASGVTAGSRWLMQLASSHVDPRRLHRAPLGVDLTLFSADAASADRGSRLVHVGTLTSVKDQATLLRAFARMCTGGVCATLEIVGDGPLRGDLERVAQKLGIADRVRFRSEVDHARLPGIYRAASAFVLSSRHEAQGMVALEAAACGLPVVGTRVGVIPELTTAAVRVGDELALAEAMSTTLHDTAPVNLQDVRSEFGLEVCADRFRALYATIG